MKNGPLGTAKRLTPTTSHRPSRHPTTRGKTGSGNASSITKRRARTSCLSAEATAGIPSIWPAWRSISSRMWSRRPGVMKRSVLPGGPGCVNSPRDEGLQEPRPGLPGPRVDGAYVARFAVTCERFVQRADADDPDLPAAREYLAALRKGRRNGTRASSPNE